MWAFCHILISNLRVIGALSLSLPFLLHTPTCPMYDVACRYDAGYTYEQDWDHQISSTISGMMSDETANERCAIDLFSVLWDPFAHGMTGASRPAMITTTTNSKMDSSATMYTTVFDQHDCHLQHRRRWLRMSTES